MRKEAKRGECKKCGKEFYIHSHHIFPKAIFGEGETVQLCPNCHTHFHEYSNLNTKNPKNKEEVKKVWTKWLMKVVVACFIIGLYLFIDLFVL